MLRALAVLLLLANLLVLGWTQGLFDRLRGSRLEPEREPERLQRQVNPDQVKVLPAPAASAALAAAARAAAASEAAAASAALAAAGTCLEAGPVPASAQAAAEKLLQEHGVAPGGWTLLHGERKGTFLIYMGKYTDDETMERKVEELKRLKIETQPIKNAPDLQPGLVIGRFDDKTAAEAELGRLSQRGLRTARVVTLVPPLPLITLRVPATSDALTDKLRGLKLPNNGPAFAACGSVPPLGAAASGAVAASKP
ncbi:hypothetical protein [Aquabacterium sp.]|uniref:hypothetical protein n=1 Tax=Aquabacterium sp. TaxID=1872578 RepID=UPI00378522D8